MGRHYAPVMESMPKLRENINGDVRCSPGMAISLFRCVLDLRYSMNSVPEWPFHAHLFLFPLTDLQSWKQSIIRFKSRSASTSSLKSESGKARAGRGGDQRL